MKYQYKIREFPNGNIYFVFRHYNFISGKEKKYDDNGFHLLPFDFDFDELYCFNSSGNKNISDLKKEHSLYSSLSRSKKTVREYAMCNVWEWFGTLTFDEKKINRFDFDECSKKVRTFFNNLLKEFKTFRYLAIPEQHKNGAWHFHVLFSGLSDALFYDSGIVQNGLKIYNLTKYRFGFTNFSKVENTQKVSNYILKYISKSLLNIPDRQRFYCSKGLKKPSEQIIEFECEKLSFNEMCRIIESYGKKPVWLNSSHNFDDFYYFSVE